MRLAAPSCALGLTLLFAGCGDRSPPALWPEPPPPTLAKPIGIDVPVHEATDVDAPPSTSAAAAPSGDEAVHAPTSADEPPPPGGEPPTTVDPSPPQRPPMPPLVP